jgi:peroxiredoxin
MVSQKNFDMKEKIRQGRRIDLRSLILIFLIVMGLAIMTLLQSKNSFLHKSSESRLVTGLPAPNFTLPGLDGKMVSLNDYRGKVVLLNIWATWCPPCVDEMPSMEKLYQELKGDGFEILAVSIDESGAKTVLPFMKRHKLSFPALTNPKGDIKNLYQITGVPESFILDQNGIIVEKIIGPRDWVSPEVIRFFINLIRRS